MFQRTLEKTIHVISESFPVLMLTGARQVGKTTLLEMCAQGRRAYVTLDDLDARNLAQSDPALFLQTWKPPLIIDEISMRRSCSAPSRSSSIGKSATDFSGSQDRRNST